MARMKRLTRSRKDHRVITSPNITRDEKGDYVGPAVNQLAAYEETGLTPTQVLSLIGEREALLTEIGMLEVQVESLQYRVDRTESEREYFRSRAEFFQEMSLFKQEGK